MQESLSRHNSYCSKLPSTAIWLQELCVLYPILTRRSDPGTHEPISHVSTGPKTLKDCDISIAITISRGRKSKGCWQKCYKDHPPSEWKALISGRTPSRKHAFNVDSDLLDPLTLPRQKQRTMLSHPNNNHDIPRELKSHPQVSGHLLRRAQS